MNRRGFVVGSCLLLMMSSLLSGEKRQNARTAVSALATTLDLSEAGAKRWLKRLGVTPKGAQVERLLVMSATGEVLIERHGDQSSVTVDAEIDNLLYRSDKALVLIHNHPASVGLSFADMLHLTKPGLAAIVAVGHDGSVFAAAAGPRIDRLWFADEQYAIAKAEVVRRLRADWPVGSVSIRPGDAHTSHLIALTLAKARIIDYWFSIRGRSERSYVPARFIFNWITARAANKLMIDRQ